MRDNSPGGEGVVMSGENVQGWEIYEAGIWRNSGWMFGGFPGCIRESGKHLSRGANVGRRANVWDTDRPLLTDNTVSSTSWGKNVQHVYCTVVWNSSNFTAQTVQQLNIVKTPVSHLINSLCHNSHYSYKCK